MDISRFSFDSESEKGMSFLFFFSLSPTLAFSGITQCNPKSVRITISIILNIRGKRVPFLREKEKKENLQS